MSILHHAIPNDPYYNNVVLHLRGYDAQSGQVFKDYSKYNRTITANGNVAHSTTQKKYGNSSIYFDGTGDYLSGQLGSSFNIRTTPHTVECWINYISKYNSILFNSDENYYPAEIYMDQLYVGDGIINNISGVSTSNIPLNTWHHIAVSFDSTTYKYFLNGILISSSTILLKNQVISNFQIGGRVVQSIYLNGYLEDLRVTLANRYSSNFPVPTQPFPNF